MARDEEKTKAQLIEELVDLRHGAALFEEAQALAKVGSWTWSVEPDSVQWSRGVYEITGLDPELTPPPIEEHAALYTPDSWQRFSEALERAVQQHTTFVLELEMLRPDGSIRTTTTIGKATTDDSGRVVRVSGTVQDITEHKKAENELAHSHEMLRYILEHNNAAVAVHDKDLKYIYVSQSYLEQYKVKDSNVIGRHHYDVFPDLPQKWRDVHQRVLEGEVCSADDDPYERADGSLE